MNGAQKTRAARPGWRRIPCGSNGGAKFGSVHQPLSVCKGAAMGHGSPASNGKQRRLDHCYEGHGKTRLEIGNHHSQGQKGIAGIRLAVSYQAGNEAEQGELVCRHLAKVGFLRGKVGYFAGIFSARGIPQKQIAIRPPETGVESHAIAPVSGVESIPTTPVSGAIRGLFAILSTPYSGDLLRFTITSLDFKEATQ